MLYPCNYGFIPNTLVEMVIPIDVLLHASHSIIPGASIQARCVGALLTEDERVKI